MLNRSQSDLTNRRGNNAFPFDRDASKERCLRYRRKILDISQKVPALHIAPAFSCVEIVDAVYHGLMRRNEDGEFGDSFLMSKGHGCMIQYVILAELGVLSQNDLDMYCKPGGRLGAHPDYGVPGVLAATGSLGHGMGMAVGMTYADRVADLDRNTYVVLSDGEMQEGSSWEAMMMAANLGVNNLIAILDLNDFQGLGQTSITHPAFYPVNQKVAAFGWEVAEIDGHDAAALVTAIAERRGEKPMFIIARTVKGRGVSYMENEPIWHYRSPNKAEYEQALRELSEQQ